MTQASTQVSINGSRLVRFLSGLVVTDEVPEQKKLSQPRSQQGSQQLSQQSSQQLSQQLGKLIDFSSSVTLSDLHSKLGKLKFEPYSVPSEACQEEFLRVRSLLVESIAKSFIQGEETSQVRIRFPLPKPDTSLSDAEGYEPYRRFYTAHQREIDAKAQYLRSFVRDAASGLSPRLMQLVELDTRVGEIMTVHQRQCFAVVPKLLEKRFAQLFRDNPQSSDEQHDDITAQRLRQFGQEVQGLLLAELEVRLQPVVGLIEAINEEADNQHD
jgi:Protein of unknown function (DUF3348)